MASGDVLVPPTTSTSGMMWGGLNGWPTMTRSGCLQSDWITLGVIPEELEAMIESTGVFSSMSANVFILKPGGGGPFSWTGPAVAGACPMSGVKVKGSRDAPAD